MPDRMTDQEWEAQNGNLSPEDADAQGLCWGCSGQGVNFHAFGGVQRKAPCPECRGNCKARR
jgi:DnaJ-class molecular chaperone